MSGLIHNSCYHENLAYLSRYKMTTVSIIPLVTFMMFVIILDTRSVMWNFKQKR